MPIFFPSIDDKTCREGAPEEAALRPPADAKLLPLDLQPSSPPGDEPAAISALRLAAKANAQAIVTATHNAWHEEHPPATAVAAFAVALAGPPTLPALDDRSLVMPPWLGLEPQWQPDQLDFFKSRPGARVYTQPPAKVETDPDWLMRPLVDGPFEYDKDGSLRSRWDYLVSIFCLYCAYECQLCRGLFGVRACVSQN